MKASRNEQRNRFLATDSEWCSKSAILSNTP